ncbi:excinuclease ABC subunit UvrC [Patescibacteria group bacterium]|nr:excinuclease ABC subunit UvrC [Patescibacteria group bacterium]
MTNIIYSNLPDTPGVYIMKDAAGKILYVGKAVNLKRRVSSYFLRPHDARIDGLVRRINKIEHRHTDTGLEALILEAALIKKHQPPWNVLEKDDKSFLYVEITKEKFPRVLLVRGKDKPNGKRYGPFTSAASVREALRLIRRIFPYPTHATPAKPSARACFDYGIGLCPGTCIGAVSRTDYMKNIRNIELLFSGKKARIVSGLEKAMKEASRRTEFEKAEKYKRQLFALRHIQDVALIKEDSIEDRSYRGRRIEGYDISNISGTSAVGSMVVFENNRPAKGEYRKFRIRTVGQPDDFAMLQEVITRRLKHDEWPTPDLMLIDGGKGQVSAVKKMVATSGREIPVIGLVKGPERKRNDVVGKVPAFTGLKTLIQVRDESHRFAIKYHRELRGRNFIKKGR